MRYSYGRRMACKHCGGDIEYHGPEHGWIDRGGNHRCATSGHVLYVWSPLDGERVPVHVKPSQKHTPYLGGQS